MDDEKLVRMANQFADFFRAYPRADAAAGIADHIQQFWSGKMQAAFRDRVGRDRTGVDPLVVRAVLGHDEGESPILKETQGPGVLGQMTSDAG